MQSVQISLSANLSSSIRAIWLRLVHIEKPPCAVSPHARVPKRPAVSRLFKRRRWREGRIARRPCTAGASQCALLPERAASPRDQALGTGTDDGCKRRTYSLRLHTYMHLIFGKSVKMDPRHGVWARLEYPPCILAHFSAPRPYHSRLHRHAGKRAIALENRPSLSIFSVLLVMAFSRSSLISHPGLEPGGEPLPVPHPDSPKPLRTSRYLSSKAALRREQAHFCWLQHARPAKQSSTLTRNCNPTPITKLARVSCLISRDWPWHLFRGRKGLHSLSRALLLVDARLLALWSLVMCNWGHQGAWGNG